MKFISCHFQICLLLFSIIVFNSCAERENSNTHQNSVDALDLKADNVGAMGNESVVSNNEPISQFVRRIYQDNDGNYWF
jgi:hypothetical protein